MPQKKKKNSHAMREFNIFKELLRLYKIQNEVADSFLLHAIYFMGSLKLIEKQL